MLELTAWMTGPWLARAPARTRRPWRRGGRDVLVEEGEEEEVPVTELELLHMRLQERVVQTEGVQRNIKTAEK